MTAVGGKGSAVHGKTKKLRSGFTTGACAAAAAKAAALLLFSAAARKSGSTGEKGEVEIPFPDGSRVKFRVKGSGFRDQGKAAWASVVKDAGDDPDITNGAEIVAEVKIVQKRGSAEARKQETSSLVIKGGKGVGRVTKPGLPVPVGEPAINPVPRKMITEAVMEAVRDSAKVQKFRSSKEKKFPHVTYALPHFCPSALFEITISIPGGEELAKKTLNSRLGIVGGISILGTTGIVKPVSTEAWTATISSSMDVAKAIGHRAIVLSAGRTSEKAHMKKFGLPEESYVLMGDHLEFSLREAVKREFEKIYLCAQWAKMVKIAMATPQTHVRFGAIEMKRAVQFLKALGIDVPRKEYNTAREIFDLVDPKHFPGVCTAARLYAERITEGIHVITCLVSYEGEVIAGSE